MGRNTTSTAAPADGDDPKKKKNLRAKIAGRSPTIGYHPTGYGWWGYGAAALDGAPIFTWIDIPRMLRDPQVRFIERLWRAPFQKVKWTVKATDKRVANFVSNTLRRFWRQSLPRLLSKYWRFGFAAGGAEFIPHRGRHRLNTVRALECRDVQPRVWANGERRGAFAGFTLRSAESSEPIWVGEPHAMWFAGYQELGEFYDSAPLGGLFEPWLEKRGRNGAVHARRLWFRKGAWRGKKIYYPPGKTNVGPDESPVERDNQDIARELLDYAEAGGTYAFENVANAGMEGKYDWDMEDDAPQADIAGFREYPRDLDMEMLDGAGIPREVVQSSESGSGYNGRLLPYQGFLGTVDELSGLIVNACEPWLRGAVTINFGASVWYEIQLQSLEEQAEQENLQNQKRSGDLPAAAAKGMGAKPFQAKGTSAGGDIPFDLSTTDSELPVLRTLLNLNAKVDHLLFGKPLELAATTTPDDDPGVKQAAFQQVNKKLMRSRKSTIAQLLALAMIRTQQRATAAGKPEAAAGSLEALANLAGDPVQVAQIVGMKELSALELSWEPFTGAKGGQGWYNTETNEKRYQKTKPGERKEKQEASEKAGLEIIAKVAKRRATPEEVAELATHLPVMRGRELVKARAVLEANLRGERQKTFMVQRLLDHVARSKEIRAAVPKELKLPDEAAAKSRAAKKSKLAGTVAQSVIDFGGIDPDDHAFRTVYGSVKEAVQDGVPLAAFRDSKGRRGHSGLDALAGELHHSGHIRIPAGKRPEEFVLDLLKKGAKAHGEESAAEQDKKYEEYLKNRHGPQADEKKTTPEPKLNSKGYPADWDEPAEVKGGAEPAPATESARTEEPPPAPVAKEIAKEVAKPAPAKKRPKNTPVHVAETEANALKAAVAYNAVVEATRDGASPEQVKKLHDRAAAAADGVPEDKRGQFLAHLTNAAAGKGKLLPIPKAHESELEDVQPDEELPPVEAAPVPAATRDDDDETTEEPVEKSTLEIKADAARREWLGAVAKKKPAATIARLKKRSDDLKTALSGTAKSAVAGLLDDPETQALLAKRRAAKSVAPAPVAEPASNGPPAQATEPEAAKPQSPPKREPKKPPKEKAAPKPKVPKKAPSLEQAESDPHADRNYLAAVTAQYPEDSDARDYLDAALHNLLEPDADEKAGSGTRRRDTLDNLGAQWRAAFRAGKGEAADSLAKVIHSFGGKLKGDPRKVTQFDGRLFDGPTGVFTNDPVVVERPAVVLTDPKTGHEYVAAKGAVRKASLAKPAPEVAPAPSAPPSAGSDEDLDAAAARVEDEARKDRGWRQSGAYRIALLRGELNKTGDRARHLDLNGIADALRNYATTEKNLADPVGATVDRLARALTARMSPEQKGELVKIYRQLNRYNEDGFAPSVRAIEPPGD